VIERVDGQHVRVSGEMTIAHARELSTALDAYLGAPELVVDLGAVSEVDSSGLAVMLGWMRNARAGTCRLRFTSIPQGLNTLASLYGVTDLLVH